MRATTAMATIFRTCALHGARAIVRGAAAATRALHQQRRHAIEVTGMEQPAATRVNVTRAAGAFKNDP